MRYDAFLHKFKTDRGLLIFVPTEEGRERGEKLIKAILRRWTPPDYFFHFQKGGHVTASFIQLSNFVFARLDIRSFFDSVSRSKVHRALRRLGFRHDDAWDIAVQSTVKKEALSGYSLPFGFVQSPVLASVALDLSALGTALRAAGDIRVAVYVDDILLSATNEADLKAFVAKLQNAAAAAGFQLHAGKAQLGAEVEAFNLRLSHEHARITDARMAKFAEAGGSATGLREQAIVYYVDGINADQAEELRKIYGIS